jgi:hypothetical protein
LNRVVKNSLVPYIKGKKKKKKKKNLRSCLYLLFSLQSKKASTMQSPKALFFAIEAVKAFIVDGTKL